jgi:hypothetical protein
VGGLLRSAQQWPEFSGRHRARPDPTIDIEEFVSKADIDPRYLIRSHYLLPIRANINPTPPRPSTMAAPISSALGRCF